MRVHRRMHVVVRDLFLMPLAAWCVAAASGQSLPFFLQRFRPVRHQGLLSSGSYPSSSYSSLFPASSSLLSSAYGAGSSLSGLAAMHQGAGLSLSSPFTASASSLSPHHLGLSSSSLFAPPTFGSSAHHLTGLGSSNYHQAASSSPFGFFPSSGHHFGAPISFGSSQFGSSPHRFASSAQASSPSFDLGTVGGGIEGLGGFDQAELLDDYQGFSGSGFAKDLNFAASHPSVKFQSASHPYGGAEQLLYLQRSPE